MATLTTTKPKKTTPRALALFSGPDFGAGQLESRLADATGQYRAKFLEGFDLPDVVRREAEDRTPAIKLTRAGLEAKYTGPQYADPTSGSYVDPDTRRALVDQEFTGGREYLSRITDKVGRLYDRDVEASRGAVEDIDKQLARAHALLDEDRQRKNSLADYERQKQIDRRYDKPTGTGTGLGDPETLGLVNAVMQNPAYFEQLTPSQKGAIIPYLNAGGFDFTPKNVRNTYEVLSKSAAQVKAIGDAAQKLNTSGPYTSLLTGPIKKFQANRGTNEDAVKLQQLGEGLLGNLARAVGGEKGVLTDQDIARARNLIPQIGEPAAKTKTKITTLVSLINELQDRANKAYTQPLATGNQGGGVDPLGIR